MIADFRGAMKQHKHFFLHQGMLFSASQSHGSRRLNLREPFVAHAKFCLCYSNILHSNRKMHDILQLDSGLYIAGHYTSHTGHTDHYSL